MKLASHLRERAGIFQGHTPRIGSYQTQLPFAKDLLDFWLTRFPRLYLRLEERRAWQNWDKRVYLSIVERGDTVVDVGANAGAHTVALSHIVGSGGMVIAFEPVPVNFARLCTTVSTRTRYSNTSLHQVALGDPASDWEQVLVIVPGDDFTQASLAKHSAGSWRNDTRVSEFPVRLTSLDAEVRKLSIDRLDLMKIDVEGGELHVMKGAVDVLTRFLPILYCEVYEKWTASFGYRPVDLFDFARSFGYTEARVIRDGRVLAANLDEPMPDGLFDASSDVLLIAPQHSPRIRRFDDRYRGAMRIDSFGSPSR